MSTEIINAIQHLNSILPLQAGLESLSNDDAALYCKILNSYVQTGGSLSRKDTATLVDNIDKSLANIEQQKLIVLDDSGEPIGAYPFTSGEREHKISINGIDAYCMCALDAIAVSLMFKLPVEINSRCRITGEPIHLLQQGERFTDGTLDAMFGIDWNAGSASACAADTLCTEMIFLANEDIAHNWQSESPDTREIFNLDSAQEFAAGFFAPLAEYCRQII